MSEFIDIQITENTLNLQSQLKANRLDINHAYPKLNLMVPEYVLKGEPFWLITHFFEQRKRIFKLQIELSII